MPEPRNIHTIPRSVSNRGFMEKYARPGMVGLACGDTLIDRAIARAERHVDPAGAWGRWTHAFVIGERRCDGQLWVIESDLEVHSKHIRLGAQENRITKYDDEKMYTSLALLDFGLPPEAVTQALAAGLDMVALSQLAEKGTPVGGNQRLIREMEQRSGVKMTDIGKNPGAYHYSSPLTEAAQVKCPILLISGRNDNNAPLPVMDGYVDKLRAVGKIAETYHPDNGPHGFYVGLPKSIPETAESTQRAVVFIKRHFDSAKP